MNLGKWIKELEDVKKEEEELEKKRREAAKKGELEATIVEVREGTYGDFMDEEVIAKLKGVDKDTEALQIVVENKDYDIRVVQTFKKSLHRRANFRKFLEHYGTSDKVKIVFDRSSERWKIFIP